MELPSIPIPFFGFSGYEPMSPTTLVRNAEHGIIDHHYARVLVRSSMACDLILRELWEQGNPNCFSGSDMAETKLNSAGKSPQTNKLASSSLLTAILNQIYGYQRRSIRSAEESMLSTLTPDRRSGRLSVDGNRPFRPNILFVNTRQLHVRDDINKVDMGKDLHELLRKVEWKSPGSASNTSAHVSSTAVHAGDITTSPGGVTKFLNQDTKSTSARRSASAQMQFLDFLNEQVATSNEVEPICQPIAVVVFLHVGEPDIVQKIESLADPPLSELPEAYRDEVFSLAYSTRFYILVQRGTSAREQEHAANAWTALTAKFGQTPYAHLLVLHEDDGTNTPVEVRVKESIEDILQVWINQVIDKKIEELNSFVERNRKGVKNAFKSWFRSSPEKAKQDTPRSSSRAGGDTPNGSSAQTGPPGFHTLTEFRLHMLGDMLFLKRDYEQALSWYRAATQDYKLLKFQIPAAFTLQMCAECIIRSNGPRKEAMANMESSIEIFVRSGLTLQAIYCAIVLSHFLASSQRADAAVNILIRVIGMTAGKKFELAENIALGFVMDRCAALFASLGQKRKACLYNMFAAERLNTVELLNLARPLYINVITLTDRMGWPETSKDVNLCIAEIDVTENRPLEALYHLNQVFSKQGLGSMLNTSAAKNVNTLNMHQDSMNLNFQVRLFECLFKAERLKRQTFLTSKVEHELAEKVDVVVDPNTSHDVSYPHIFDSTAIVKTWDWREENPATFVKEEWDQIERQALHWMDSLFMQANRKGKLKETHVKEVLLDLPILKSKRILNQSEYGLLSSHRHHHGHGQLQQHQHQHRQYIYQNHHRDHHDHGHHRLHTIHHSTQPRFSTIDEPVEFSFVVFNTMSLPVRIRNTKISVRFFDPLTKDPVPVSECIKHGSSEEFLLMPQAKSLVTLNFAVKRIGVLKILGVEWEFFADLPFRKSGESRPIEWCEGKHLFQRPGIRLNDTRAQRTGTERTADRSLEIVIIPNLPRLRLNIEGIPDGESARFREGQLVNVTLGIDNDSETAIDLAGYMVGTPDTAWINWYDPGDARKKRSKSRARAVSKPSAQTEDYKSVDGALESEALENGDSLLAGDQSDSLSDSSISTPSTASSSSLVPSSILDPYPRGVFSKPILSKTKKSFPMVVRVPQSPSLQPKEVVRVVVIYAAIVSQSHIVWRLARASVCLKVVRCLNVFPRFVRPYSPSSVPAAWSAPNFNRTNRSFILGLEVEHCWREGGESYNISCISLCGNGENAKNAKISRTATPLQIIRVEQNDDSKLLSKDEEIAAKPLARQDNQLGDDDIRLRVNETGTLFIIYETESLSSVQERKNQAGGSYSDTDISDDMDVARKYPVQTLNLSNNRAIQDVGIHHNERVYSYFIHHGYLAHMKSGTTTSTTDREGNSSALNRILSSSTAAAKLETILLGIHWEHKHSQSSGVLLVDILNPEEWIVRATSKLPYRTSLRADPLSFIEPVPAPNLNISYELAAPPVIDGDAPCVTLGIDAKIVNISKLPVHLKLYLPNIIPCTHGCLEECTSLVWSGDVSTVIKYLAPRQTRILRLYCSAFKLGMYRSAGLEVYPLYFERGAAPVQSSALPKLESKDGALNEPASGTSASAGSAAGGASSASTNDSSASKGMIVGPRWRPPSKESQLPIQFKIRSFDPRDANAVAFG